MSAIANNASIKVAVVEDTSRFSKALREALNAAVQLQCIGVCQSATEALANLPIWRPDVVLLDLDLGPGKGGLDVLSELASKIPDTRFLILTVLDDPKAVFEAAKRGAAGYLRKSIPLAELPEIILEVHQGQLRFSPEVFDLIWKAFKNPRPSDSEVEKLSPREAEVLDFLAQGYQPKELSIKLSMGRETMKTHIRNIHKKLLVCSTQAAVQKVYPTKRFWLLPRSGNGGAI
jgi:DNA-binding NarL/FixJ family response regulator